MLKDIFWVGVGSFFGGSARLVVSRAVQRWTAMPLPWGTLSVNVLGCLLLGFLSGLDGICGTMNPTTKLTLTTGFCGGFTTFSTFMGEGVALRDAGHGFHALLYLFGSLALGMAMVILGSWLARVVQGR